MNGLFLLGISILAAVEVVLTRAAEPALVEIRYERPASVVERCVRGGFAFQVRFKLRACERFRSSYRNCRDERVFIQKLRYEPLPGMYILSQNELRDGRQEEEFFFRDSAEALEQTLTLRSEALSRDSVLESLQRLDDPVLTVSADSYCQGEYSRSLARISRALTFGALNFGEDSTGWLKFESGTILNPGTPE